MLPEALAVQAQSCLGEYSGARRQRLGEQLAEAFAQDPDARSLPGCWPVALLSPSCATQAGLLLELVIRGFAGSLCPNQNSVNCIRCC